MKNLILISVFGFLSVFTVSGQAVQEHHYDPHNTFAANTLSTEELNAFETRAIEKLNEFYQYLAIVCNKKSDAGLRQQARNQAAGLFADDQSPIRQIKCEVFLDSCLKGKLNPVTTITNVTTKEEFKSDSDFPFSYTGTLEFKEGKETRKAKIRLLKRSKQFGKESKSVWVVLIEEIS